MNVIEQGRIINDGYRRGRWLVVRCASCSGVSQDQRLDLLLKRQWQWIKGKMYCPKCKGARGKPRNDHENLFQSARGDS